MYKYLTEKLEQSKGVHIEDMVLIAFAVNNQTDNELLEDFSSLEYKKICEVLNWKDNDEVHTMLKDEFNDGGNIQGIMYRYNQTGFLAKIHIEIPTLSKSDRVIYSEGYCRIEYVYAETIGELTEKALEIGEQINEYEIKKAREEKIKEKV